MITKERAKKIVENLIDTIDEEWGSEHRKSVRPETRAQILEFIESATTSPTAI